MSTSTILRVLTTFVEIIPEAPGSITANQIENELAHRGMATSLSQLSRDLSTYSDLFNVVECGFSEGSKTWQRIGRVTPHSKMAEAEIMCLILLQDQLEMIPDFARDYLKKKMDRMVKQRNILKKNVPQHAMFKWESNTKLLLKHEKRGIIDRNIIHNIARCINERCILKFSCTDNNICTGYLDVISVTEENDELYVSGISELGGNHNSHFRVSSLTNTECQQYQEVSKPLMKKMNF